MAEHIPFVPPTSAAMRPPMPPRVTLWRVLIKPYVVPKTIDGGVIELADVAIENSKFLTTVGQVIAMGAQAFKSPKLADANNPGLGDWVMYGKYAGQRIFMRDGTELIIVNDDEIIATVENPADYMQLARS